MSPEYAKLVHALPLFAEFTEEELDGALDLVDLVEYQDAQPIVKQDEHGDCMYVLVSGKARVVHRREGRDFELATLGPGDFFGEIALVDSGPRSADVVSDGQTRLLKVEQGALRAIAGVYPNAAFKLLLAVGAELVHRMRRGNQKYVDSLLAGSGKD